MIEVVIYVFLYLAIILFDVIPLIKKKRKKALLIYIPILLLTLVINILHGMGVKIPSPAEPIKEIVNGIFGTK